MSATSKAKYPTVKTEKAVKIKIPSTIESKLNSTLRTEVEIKTIEDTAMGDDTIKAYYPNATIITYDKLKNYNKIEDLLNGNNSYCFLLYTTEALNCGHWTLLCRHNDYIEYWDSYGGTVDNPLKWISNEKKKELKIFEPYLQQLLKKTKLDVYFNPIDYQSSKDNDISTCGRYCVLRLKTILDYEMDLKAFYNMMLSLKKHYNMTFDELVSDIIDKL